MDLRQRASSHTTNNLGFSGFLSPSSSSSSSSSNGFLFSGDRTTNPYLNHHRYYNHHTTASMADFDLDLLSQNLSQMGLNSDRTFTGFNHSVTRNLHVHRPPPPPPPLRDGCLVNQSFHGDDFLRREQNLRASSSSSRQGFLQSFHGGESSYVDDGDDYYRRLRFLGLQDYSSPNPNSNSNPRGGGFMSLHNRDYYPLENSRLAFHQQNHNTDSPLDPPELEGKKKKNSTTSFSEEDDSPLDLASLVDVYGSVYLMAKNQMGCRLLQKIIEQGSFVDFVIITKEVMNHVTELGMDPFGNYFIQKLLEVCSQEQRTQILIMFTSKPKLLVKISLNTYGTRVVQKLIEMVRTKEQISLIKSALKPGFLSLVKDLNGNHVLYTCLKSFGPNDNKFILEAAIQFCPEIATHRHGCCVLQQCVLYSSGDQREKLVAEISRNSLHLAQDPYGNYVVQYIIEKKLEGANVLFELRGNYVKLATQKFGSHVVEKCLRYYPQSREQIVRELASVPNFGTLLQDQYANYVIQSALSVTKGLVRTTLVEKARRYENLRMSPYCKRIFSKSLLKKK